MDGGGGQDTRYADAAALFGAALERLARGYEADADRRRDLLQDIHVALWRSFAVFEGQCSVRSWVYRIAHNVGATHVLRRRRHDVFTAKSLDELAAAPAPENPEQETGERHALARLLHLIHQLRPPDAEVMLLYLEDVDAAGIAEITGLSPAAVATRIHRIKAVLARQFSEGVRHGG
jgi:RNA polymerase sigma-70 factor (ECF subfamily)